MTKVFVYGSLMRGLHNSHLLATSKLVNLHARTNAADYCLVASAELERGHTYPYAIPHQHARVGDVRTALRGETYLISDAVLELLDELEEHPGYYRREVVPLLDEAEAWTYLLHDEVQLEAIRLDSARDIFRVVSPAGDWRAFLGTHSEG